MEKFLSYEAAKDYIHSLKLVKYIEFANLIKENKLPRNIPSAPHYVYKNKGWVSGKDWIGPTWKGKLGVKRISCKPYTSWRNSKVNFETARNEIIKLNLTSCVEYSTFVSENKRTDLPACPAAFYKNSGWIDWNHFLGRTGFVDTAKIKTGNNIPKSIIGKRLKYSSYATYDEAKNIMAKFNLKNWRDWYKFRKSDSRPFNITSTPEKYYKNSGWISMQHFLSI